MQEIIDLLKAYRSTIGGALWTLDDDEREEAERIEAVVEDLQQQGEVVHERRDDGTLARKDRWENAIRSIVTHLWGPSAEFEVEDVVEAVKAYIYHPQHSASQGESATTGTDIERIRQALRKMLAFHEDVLKSNGGNLILQDYGQANDAAVESREILEQLSDEGSESQLDKGFSRGVAVALSMVDDEYKYLEIVRECGGFDKLMADANDYDRQHLQRIKDWSERDD